MTTITLNNKYVIDNFELFEKVNSQSTEVTSKIQSIRNSVIKNMRDLCQNLTSNLKSEECQSKIEKKCNENENLIKKMATQLKPSELFILKKVSQSLKATDILLEKGQIRNEICLFWEKKSIQQAAQYLEKEKLRIDICTEAKKLKALDEKLTLANLWLEGKTNEVVNLKAQIQETIKNLKQMSIEFRAYNSKKRQGQMLSEREEDKVVKKSKQSSEEK